MSRLSPGASGVEVSGNLRGTGEHASELSRQQEKVVHLLQEGLGAAPPAPATLGGLFLPW